MQCAQARRIRLLLNALEMARHKSALDPELLDRLLELIGSDVSGKSQNVVSKRISQYLPDDFPVNATTVGRWRNRKNAPRDRDILAAIARAYPCNPGWLAFGDSCASKYHLVPAMKRDVGPLVEGHSGTATTVEQDEEPEAQNSNPERAAAVGHGDPASSGDSRGGRRRKQ